MNRPKRVFFTWYDGALVAFNTFDEATEYLRSKYGVLALKDVPGGWFGIDHNGNAHWLWTTIIHFNDGKMVYE